MIPIIFLLGLTSFVAGLQCSNWPTGLKVVSFTPGSFTNGQTWPSYGPYVKFGCTDNGFPTNSSTTGCGDYTLGLNLNSGAGGNYVFVGAKIGYVCEGDGTPVMTNATISSDSTCASIGDGSWVPAEGNINLNDGISGAPALYACVKMGSASNTNLLGIYLTHFTYTLNPNDAGGAQTTYYSTDLNAGTNGAPIYFSMRINECGGQCTNGGLCITGTCTCASGNCPLVSTAGRSIGCFSDNAYLIASGPQRDLPKQIVYTSSGSLTFTPNQCVASCMNAGYAYAGSQNGGECWCGNSYGSYCPGVSGVCNKTCYTYPGSPQSFSSLTCGAANFNMVYQAAATGGSGQAATCTCGTPGSCAGVKATINAYGCATASDASTIDFTVAANTGVAPFKYSISGGAFTTYTQFSVDAEGSYTVKVVDNTGLFYSTSVYAGPAKRVNVIPTPYTPYGTLSGYRTSAVGSADAFVNSVAQNGTAPYKFTLYPVGINTAFTGTTAGSFSALPAGNYNLIATDANGCRSTPVPITVNTPSLAAPPTNVNALDVNVNQKPVASIAWTTPVFNGYSAITGYSVLVGYWNDATSSIVWAINTTASSSVNSTTVTDVMNNSTRRFVSIASINGVGLGAYSAAVEFVGMCAAGRFANSTICQDCLAGSNTLGNIGKSVCRPCASGTYSGQAAPICTACVGNTYSASGATSCSICGDGYVTNPTHYYCQPCAAGSYAAGGNTTCTACPANTYSGQPASATCTACPTGLTSNPGSYQCQDNTGYKK